jgi:hypothetical protein
LSRDYDSTTIGAPEMTAVAALANAGFPKVTLLKVLKAGGIVAAEDDITELAMEWEMGGMAAEAAPPA